MAAFPSSSAEKIGGRALLLVLALGVVVCWAPGIWPVALAQVGVLGIAALSLYSVRLRGHLALYLAAAVALWPLLQALAGLTVYPFATWASALIWLTNFVALGLGFHLLAERESRTRFIDGLLWFASAISLLAMFQYFTEPEKVFWLFERPGSIGPFIYKNQFAAFVELAFPVAVFGALRVRSRRLLYGGCATVLFAAVIVSMSRGGAALLVAELAAVLVAAWRRKLVGGRELRLVGAQLVVVLGIGLAAVGWQSIWGHFQEKTTITVRENLAHSTLRMIAERPLGGFGVGTWRQVYPQFATFDNTLFANAAHNDWLEWAADGGVPWALLLLGLAGMSAWAAWRCPWAMGVPAVFAHGLWDYPTREPVVGLILWVMLGAALACGTMRDTPHSRGAR